MAFKALVSPSLTDLFVEELKKMILTQTLKIGEKLPPERQMAAEMNVSLAVVNSGITRLTTNGFLRVVPRKGVFVADYVREGNIFTLIDIMNFQGLGFQEDILDPLIAFRRSVESSALLYACKNRTDENLNRMKLLTEQAAAKENIRNFPEIGFRFHHEIAIASGNIYYPMMLQTFKPVYLFFYRNYVTIQNQSEKVEELFDLYEAIKRKDINAASLRQTELIDQWARYANIKK